jgi:hypothetical protein
MGRLISFLFGILLVGSLLAFVVFKVELALVATVTMGALCLTWLAAIVVLPWNLYFRARHLLAEMQVSDRRGIAVDTEARAEGGRVASRMLRISVGLHLVSGALLAAAAWLFGQRLGYAFSALFLLSTLFRPAFEYYAYVQRKLAEFLNRVRYPREDVVKLVADVRSLTTASQAQQKTIEALAQNLGNLGQTVQAGDRENQRRLDALARKFEETIDRLTDNQEIISGIKAFLRLVQADRVGSTGTVGGSVPR